MQAEGTIQSVDLLRHEVTLRLTDREPLTLRVPGRVSLDALSTDDNVLVSLRRAMSIQAIPMAPEAAETWIVAIKAADETAASEASSDAASAAGSLNQVQGPTLAKVTSIDTLGGELSVRGKDGDVRVLSIKGERMQERLRTLTVGDRVKLRFVGDSVAWLWP